MVSYFSQLINLFYVASGMSEKICSAIKLHAVCILQAININWKRIVCQILIIKLMIKHKYCIEIIRIIRNMRFTCANRISRINEKSHQTNTNIVDKLIVKIDALMHYQASQGNGKGKHFVGK